MKQLKIFGVLQHGSKSDGVPASFIPIKVRDVSIVIRLSDNGIVGYIVSGRLIDDQLMHVEKLEAWVEKYEEELPRAYDAKRGLTCNRKYQYWVKTNKGFVPQFSVDYKNDGEISNQFM